MAKFIRCFFYIIPFLALSPMMVNSAQPSTYKNLQNIQLPARYTATVSPVGKPSFPTQTFGSASNELFPPASTLKLLTATAAKLVLGDSFSFTTSLLRANNDIIIKFSGDPTLTTKDLSQLLSKLTFSGVKRIKGDIWIDNSQFDGYEAAVGWPWDILGVCYSAPSSAVTLDRNCVYGSIYTNDDGTTRVYVPKAFPVVATTSSVAVSLEEQKKKRCFLDLYSTRENHYHLDGCLAFRNDPLPLKFAVRAPSLYAKEQVVSILKRLKIKLDGDIKIGTPTSKKEKQLLAIKRSPVLSDLITTMLHRSDNLIANNIAKTIGAKFYNQPGSFSNAALAMKEVLGKEGINLDTAQIYDGSGLSRSNRLSAKQLVDVLEYIAENDSKLHLVASMAKAGESGTLRNRSSMRKAPVKGAIIGKSGSLYGTYNMAGFGLDKAGKPSSAFVQLVTDYFPETKKQKSQLPLFEREFYQYIVKSSK
ncbi:D-alanyl-D-alanine carboxypeptidase/D-alanyl-D-alanine endopeptidase [Vibrio sp. WJH972]